MALPQPPTPTTTTCFRHPGREAWRRCTRCGRAACAECLVQAQVGSHCVECAKQSRPDVRTRARYWNARQPTLVTYALMAINLGVFAWLAFQDPDSLTGTREITEGQFDLGLAEPLLDRGEWYRLVTSGFLHFGIIHIAFNMLLLYQLGQLLEPAIGRIRFALLYFAALLGGSAGALLLQPERVPRGRLGRGVRADGRGVRRPAPPRRQSDDDRARHDAAAQPVAHVHDPRDLDRRSPRRHHRWRGRGLGRPRPRLQGNAALGDLRRPGRGDRALRDHLGRRRRLRF